MFLMVLLVIGMLATAPAVKTQLQRDREEEMIHRGAQYSRAIKRYVKKFGRYPGTLDQLEDTNGIRFLRKQYKDPMVADGKWRLLHYGDVKIGTVSNIGTPVSAMGTLGGSSANVGQSAGQATMGGAPGMTSPGNPSSSTGSSTFAIGAGAIIGVASLSEKGGLHEFNEKTHYNDWYFVYDRTIDLGGLIRGPYTGKTFVTAGNVGAVTRMGAQGQLQGSFGQPFSLGQPSSFSQPAPVGQSSSFGQPQLQLQNPR